MKRLFLTVGLFVAFAATSSAQHALDPMWELANSGKLDEAIAGAEEYVGEHPEDPMGLHTLGRFLYMVGEDEIAIETLLGCLELQPEPAHVEAWTHCVLGQAYARAGEKEEAEAHLRRAIEMDATSNCTRQAHASLAALLGEDPWGRGYLFGKSIPEFTFHDTVGRAWTREDFVDRAVLFRFGPSW